MPISIFEVEEPPVVPVWFVGADDDQPCAVSTVKVSRTGRLAAMMPKTASEALAGVPLARLGVPELPVETLTSTGDVVARPETWAL